MSSFPNHALSLALLTLAASATFAACTSSNDNGATRRFQHTDSRVDAAPQNDAQSTEGDETDASIAEDTSVDDASADAPLHDASTYCPRVRIDLPLGSPLYVRPKPSTVDDPVGEVYGGFVLDVMGVEQGELVAGTEDWLAVKTLQASGYISAAFAECSEAQVGDLAAPNGFYLPFECGHKTTVTQGNNGPRHYGNFVYAFDFAVSLELPLVSVADGLVMRTYNETKPGSACDAGGEECSAFANYVLLLHGDGTTSTYRHLLRTSVKAGDFITRGTVVGYAGQSGWATGPHFHFARMDNCGKAFQPQGGGCASIPTKFKDVAGDGVPDYGQSVTSGNCP